MKGTTITQYHVYMTLEALRWSLVYNGQGHPGIAIETLWTYTDMFYSQATRRLGFRRHENSD